MTHQIDEHVGRSIRAYRKLKGYSQQQLAEKVGVKFQQLQKYETGLNRVSASRLWMIADALGIAPSAFFPDDNDDHVFTEDNDDHVFTEDEARLIQQFRGLDDDRKASVLRVAEALA